MFVEGKDDMVHCSFKALLGSGAKPEEAPALKMYFLYMWKLRRGLRRVVWMSDHTLRMTSDKLFDPDGKQFQVRLHPW